MISYIKLKNFKSFSDVQLDLRGAHGIPKKVALIYGENGSGKSNLMLAPLFVSQTFETMRKDDKLPILDDLNGIGDEAFRNKIISEILKLRFASLEDLIGKYWTIGNENPMEIEIGFFHKNKSGRYQMVFSKSAVIKEELFYLVKQRSGRIFSITPKKATLSPSVFANLKYKEELQELISKYWGKHTFMSILYAEEKNTPGEYMPIETNEYGTSIFSSKDLCLINEIPEIVDMGIDSLKIEGRLKTEYYIASVVSVYRAAIDDYIKDPQHYDGAKYLKELEKIKTRSLTTFYFNDRNNKDIQEYAGRQYNEKYEFEKTVVEIRNRLQVGDELELLIPNEFEPVKFKIEKLWDAETGEEVDHVSPGVKGQQILLHIPVKCEKDWILRHTK